MLVAGVFMNITLAIFIYLCIYMSLNSYVSTKIGSNSSNEYLTSYGLEVGDEIYKINGEKMYNSSDIERVIAKSKNDFFEFEIIRSNNEHYVRDVKVEGINTGYIGVAFSDLVVADVVKDKVGDKAGIKINDEIVSVNGIESTDIYEYLKIIKDNPDKEVKVSVKRGDEIITLNMVPEPVYKRSLNVEFIAMNDLDFFHNLIYAWKETKYYLKANIVGIFELLTGRAENVEVQGIVGVSQMVSRTETLIEFFYFMSAISLSLGIMNLLPIPGLDGGKLLLVIIEGVRGKPIDKETEGKITLVGFAILIALMIFVTVNDISKLF